MTGSVLEAVIRQPRRLRSADFAVQVTRYSDWHPESPARGAARGGPALVHAERLSVTRDHWTYTREVPEGEIGTLGAEGDGPWWELPYPALIEHLDPALVLTSLSDFTASSESDGAHLRAKPRHQGDVDAAAALVDCDADLWLGLVDLEWGILREVESRSKWAGGFRSVLEWTLEPQFHDAGAD